jgi:hypothetical protein
MAYVYLGAFGLPDFGEQFVKPRFFDVEGFSSCNAWKFNRSEFVVLIFIMTNYSANALQGGVDGDIGAGFNEGEIFGVGCGRSGIVT